MERLKGYGIECAQICSWAIDTFTDEKAAEVRSAIADTGIEIRTFWCGWPGPASWTFYDGPLTLGLVPAAYRFERTKALLKGIDALGIAVLDGKTVGLCKYAIRNAA